MFLKILNIRGLLFCIVFCFCSLIGSELESFAQESNVEIENPTYEHEVLHVATKTINKVFDYKNREIIIQGEKSNITVESWTEDRVELILKLIARSESKEQATKDLKYHKYSLKETSREIYLENMFVPPADGKLLETDLKVEYLIKVPSTCRLNIKNFFGNITASSISGRLKINSEYGKVNIDDIQGRVEITTNLSDIQASNVTCNGKMNTSHSNVEMMEMEGKYKMKTEFGDIKLHISCEEVDLAIDAKRSNVELITNQYDDYNYSLESEYGKIDVPSKMGVEKLQNSEKKKFFISKNNNSGRLFNIKNSFGNIRVK